MGDVLSGIGSVAAGVGALTSDSPDIPQPKLLKQGPVFTPTFGLQSGVLSRRGDLITPRQTELGAFTRSLRGGLANIRGNLAGLREQVRPGFGRLSRIASTTIRQAGAQAVGNLRSNLARRGVLGASFAQDAIGRVQSEFAQREEQALATAAINEIAASLQIEGLDQQTSQLLLQQAQTEASLITQEIQRELSELGIAADFFSKVKQSETVSGIRRLLLDQTAAQFGLPESSVSRTATRTERPSPFGDIFGRRDGAGPGSRSGIDTARGGGLVGRGAQSESDL